MRLKGIASAVLVVSIVFTASAGEDANKSAGKIPEVYTAKFSTPDIVQTDPEGRLPKGGRSHCGPVSTSNAMMWLAENGYPNLIMKHYDSEKETHFRLADVLGSDDYMRAARSGTGAVRLIEASLQYIKERGYKAKAYYQGWRAHPKEAGGHGDKPQIEWIKQGLVGDSAVMMNIGWNKYDPNTNEYRRRSGHWMTVVGYGVDENGKKDSNILIIRDSASRAGWKPALEFVKLEEIKSGNIVTSGDNKHPAKGLCKVVGGMHIKDNFDCAILDGVVVIRLEKDEKEKPAS